VQDCVYNSALQEWVMQEKDLSAPLTPPSPAPPGQTSEADEEVPEELAGLVRLQQLAARAFHRTEALLPAACTPRGVYALDLARMERR
jgi:hypothetical protein